MRETHPKVLLERKAASLCSSTNNPHLRSQLARPFTPRLALFQALVRPTMLLLGSPILLVISLYVALVFGLMYLLFTTFTSLFEGQYGFSTSISGLVYLGLGVALIASMLLFGTLNDRVQTARMKDDGVQRPRPEYRLVLMIWFSPFVGVGLFVYGWTAYYKVHWIVPIIGTVFIGFGAFFVIVRSTPYPDWHKRTLIICRCLRSSTSSTCLAPRLLLPPWVPTTSCGTCPAPSCRLLGRACTRR